MESRKILHVVNEVTDCSISQIIANLVTHLDPSRYTWHMGGVANRDDMAPTFAALGVQVVNFSDGASGVGSLSRRIRAYISQHEIDLVHTHTVKARLVTAGATVGLRGVRHLATEHLIYRPEDRRWGHIYALMDRASMYLPDHLVTVSEGMYEEVAAMPAMRAGRLTAIQNAIDCDAFHMPAARADCRAELGIGSASYLMGYTGRITSVKGLNLLIRAFAQVVQDHPDTYVVIIGEGAERPALERLAESLNVNDRIIWTGFRQDVPRLLAAMDMFVQPSSNEGLSLSILEAMAAGKPVVVTDVGGAREVISDGETGVIVPPGSAPALAGAIADLQSHPRRAAQLGQAARQHICRRFGAQRMASDYEEVYESLVPLSADSVQAPQGSDQQVRGLGR